MLIHQEFVWKIEADAPKRIGFARWLRDVDAAVAGAFKLQSHALQHGGILLQSRQILIVNDRWGHVPCRIDRDELHGLGQKRRRVNSGLPGDHLGGPDLRPVLHHLERIIGDVENDIGIPD